MCRLHHSINKCTSYVILSALATAHASYYPHFLICKVPPMLPLQVGEVALGRLSVEMVEPLTSLATTLQDLVWNIK